MVSTKCYFIELLFYLLGTAKLPHLTFFPPCPCQLIRLTLFYYFTMFRNFYCLRGSNLYLKWSFRRNFLVDHCYGCKNQGLSTGIDRIVKLMSYPNSPLMSFSSYEMINFVVKLFFFFFFLISHKDSLISKERGTQERKLQKSSKSKKEKGWFLHTENQSNKVFYREPVK